MSEERLHVFIGYSREDHDLATAIAEELSRAFSPAILKLTIDVEFSRGANWRDRLRSDLDTTDILLVVATGKQRVSHSFTGFEVGHPPMSSPIVASKYSRPVASLRAGRQGGVN